MGLQRAHIVLPSDLVAEIDLAVGPRGRSAFLVEVARAELRRRKLLSFLRGEHAAWDEESHPELNAGSGPWVKQIRTEGEVRMPRAPRSKKKSK